jgi:hypothetical protein
VANFEALCALVRFCSDVSCGDATLLLLTQVGPTSVHGIDNVTNELAHSAGFQKLALLFDTATVVNCNVAADVKPAVAKRASTTLALCLS